MTGFGDEVSTTTKYLGFMDEVSGNSKVGSGVHKNSAKKAARNAAKTIRDEQPVSEKYAKDAAKKLERERGKEARRKAHDSKDNIGRDRTKKEIDDDYNIYNY